MAKCWTGSEIICTCGSQDIDYVDDEYCGNLEDYEVFKCNTCGKIIKIELPN